MENLNQFELEEVSKSDLKKINGGGGCPWCGPAGLLLFLLSTDWDQVGDDMARGWNDAHN